MIFSKNWWKKFIENWNVEPERCKFSGLDKIAIIFTDKGGVSVELQFDLNGNIVNIFYRINNSIPSFSASTKTWTKFISKEIGAAFGVLRGLIKYKGPTSLILRFGQNFNILAEVGSNILENKIN